MFQDYLLPILLLYILVDYTIKIRDQLSNVQGLIGNFKTVFCFYECDTYVFFDWYLFQFLWIN